MHYYSKITAVVFLLSFSFIVHASAQPPDILWTTTFGGTVEDHGYAVCSTGDGYLAVGWGASFGAGGDDIYLVRLNEDGDTLWTKTYGGLLNDRAFSIRPTSDNHYIIAGFTSSQGTGGADVWLLKVDENGDTAWTSWFGNLTWDAAYCAQETADSGFIVTGMSTIFGLGDQLFLVKTDAHGDSVWAKTYGGTNQDYGRWVEQTADGGYIVAGYTYSYGPGGSTAWLLKTNAAGDTLWTQLYGGNLDDHAFSVLPLADGTYILVGSTQSYGAGLDDVYVVRVGASGDTLWMNWYGGESADHGQSAVIAHDSTIVIAGYTWSYGLGYTDVYLLKIDLDGDTLWTKTIGGSSYDYAYSIDNTPDTGYIIVGRTRSFGAGQSDAYIIKTGADLGVTEHEELGSHSNLRIVPNPFSKLINISFEVDSRQYAVGSIEIYDICGRLVKSFNPLPYAPSYVQITWDGCDESEKALPSGVYFLRVTAGEHAETKKLLLIR
jgi:hypothetical protein